MLHLDCHLRIGSRPVRIALALSLLLQGSAIAQVTFQAGELISNDYIKANSALGCDLDGDGDDDVLTCWVKSNVVAWHENVAGDGSIWVTHHISSEIAGSRYANAADIDGDGDLDVLTAACNDDEAAWYENVNGDGLVWTKRSITVLANCAQYITAEDLDEDGDLDVVVSSYLDSKVAWHENVLGDGTVWTEWLITTDGNGGREVATADVDGDGDPDVLAAWSEAMKVAWHDNVAGDASTWTQVAITTAANGADAVIAADIDGDGDLDVVGASFADGHVRWHENAAGDGSVWISHTVDSSATLPDSIAVADVDQDGDLDIFSANFGDAEILWYENTLGDGSAWTPWLVGRSADGARRVRLSDIDGDGDLDVLGAMYESSEIKLYRNVTAPPEAIAYAAEAEIAEGVDGALSVLAFDPDGDGDLDVAAASTDDGTVAWHENTAGDASLWSSHVVSAAWSGPRSVVAADLDDDGAVDLISAAAESGAIHWHANAAGNGSTWLDQPILLAMNDPRAVHAADVDRNGVLDLFSASAGDDTVGWHQNQAGDGSAWSFVAVATDVLGAESVISADIDGDGDPDAVSAAYASGEVAWHENVAGDGSLWAKLVITSAAPGAADVFAADVDKDGDLDVLVAASLSNTITWFENLDGSGVSWLDHVVATDADHPRSVAAFDLDRDGDLDVLVASANDDTVAWYENQGGGLEWKWHSVTTKADGAADAAAADLDGDGFVDVVIAAQEGDRITWARAGASLPPLIEILPCDGNPEGSLLFLEGEPTLGGTVTLGVDNPLGSMQAESLTILVISAQLASETGCGIPLPGFGMGAEPGMLQVSLSTAHVLGLLAGPAWPGSGQSAPISFPIPASQPLVEHTIFAQGAMFDPFTFEVGLAQTAEIRIGP